MRRMISTGKLRPTGSAPLYLCLALACGLVLAGCVTFHRPDFQDVKSEVVQTPGFSIYRPAAMITPEGLRFLNWICRDSPGFFAPRSLRLERIDGSGQVVATAQGGVILPRNPECSTYNIPTGWTLAPGERVRLCVADGAKPCPVPVLGARRRR